MWKICTRFKKKHKVNSEMAYSLLSDNALKLMISFLVIIFWNCYWNELKLIEVLILCKEK